MKRRSQRSRWVCLALIWLATLVGGCKSSQWAIPQDLPTYGAATSGSIRVVVFGLAVAQPGVYWLDDTATVKDALYTAHVRTDFVQWRKSHSGIQNPTEAGVWRLIWFTKEGRKSEEHIRLQDGDRIMFSQEIY